MKVLTIAATPFFSDRGCHVRIYNEAKYLGKLGAWVRLCTYHIGKGAPEIEVRRIKGPKWYKKTAPGFHWGKIWLDLKLLFLVRREIGEFKPDVIHAHLYEGLAVGYLAKKIALRGDIPIVFDLQGNIEEEFANYSKKNKLAREIFVRIANIAIRWADKSVVSSENVKTWAPDTQTVRDGVDLEFPDIKSDPGPEDEKRIKKLKKWKGREKILMYVGGLSDNKGVGDLLETFSNFAKRNSRWKLALLGYGPDEEKYKKCIEERNIEDRIILLGRTDYFSLPHFMSCAEVVIDPKKESSESSGKLMVYMAFNLPIICIDSKFSRSRLGEKGFFMNSFRDLGSCLRKAETVEVVRYDSEKWDAGNEAKKLLEIFESLMK